MKKLACLILTIVMLFALCSCSIGGSLPKGHAKNVGLISGGSFTDVDFEYINETTVKIVETNGDVYYLPISSIRSIRVEQ